MAASSYISPDMTSVCEVTKSVTSVGKMTKSMRMLGRCALRHLATFVSLEDSTLLPILLVGCLPVVTSSRVLRARTLADLR
eukprot:3959025-Pyramimonas_sp.AAC.1